MTTDDPRPTTKAECCTYPCDPGYEYCAVRPAASGGATDGKREAWRPVCGCEQGMGHMDRGCHSYGLCHAQSAERHAPTAAVPDPRFRDQLAEALSEPRCCSRCRADAVLALAAVRRLLADAAKVQRVEEAIASLDDIAKSLERAVSGMESTQYRANELGKAMGYRRAALALRRALAGGES